MGCGFALVFAWLSPMLLFPYLAPDPRSATGEPSSGPSVWLFVFAVAGHVILLLLGAGLARLLDRRAIAKGLATSAGLTALLLAGCAGLGWLTTWVD